MVWKIGSRYGKGLFGRLDIHMSPKYCHLHLCQHLLHPSQLLVLLCQHLVLGHLNKFINSTFWSFSFKPLCHQLLQLLHHCLPLPHLNVHHRLTDSQFDKNSSSFPMRYLLHPPWPGAHFGSSRNARRGLPGNYTAGYFLN